MSLTCRGLRGATTIKENTREAILEATTELLNNLIDANNLDKNDVAATFFTTTSDVNAEFPAVAARQMGWANVPLINSHEMDVPGSLPMCIRIMLLVNTNKKPEEMNHAYLREATNLRPDITG
jgi:chorismate mutase